MFITCHSIKIQDKRDYLKQKDMGHKYHQTRHSTEWREKKIKYFGLSEESHQNSGHSLSIVAMDRRATSRPRFEAYLSHSAWKGTGTTMGIAAVV